MNITRTELKELIREVYAEVVDEKLLNESNVALQADKEFRSFYAQLYSRSAGENRRIFTALVDKNTSKLHATKDKFVKFINKHIPKKGWSGRYSFIYQLKSLKSIINKVIDRGKSIFTVGDLVRGALLFNNPKELNDWIGTFKRNASSHITSYEYKKKGEDKTYGYYGTHHFTLHFDGFDSELIVSTKKLWRYKEEAHKIYTKWRSSEKPVPKEDIAYSKFLFSKGNLVEVTEENNEDVE